MNSPEDLCGNPLTNAIVFYQISLDPEFKIMILNCIVLGTNFTYSND